MHDLHDSIILEKSNSLPCIHLIMLIVVNIAENIKKLEILISLMHAKLIKHNIKK